MKKTFLSMLIYFSFVGNAFSLTEQLEMGNLYLQEINQEVSYSNILLNHNINSEAKALAPKTEIKYGNKYEALKYYQYQNGLNPTGLFDEETLNFVRAKQEELGFNVTKTLDYNTWFATYKQPKEWELNVINDSMFQWQDIINKQKDISNSYEIQESIEISEDGIEIISLDSEKNNEVIEDLSQDKFIVVNIPSMTLHAYYWDGQRAIEAFTSRVVVGKSSSQTPQEDMYIWGLKYHPTWTPTPNMLKRNVYKKDGSINTSWLAKHDIKAVDKNGNDISYSDLAYNRDVRLYQPAGENNALGILKFETNSKQNIYLHDTNEKRYFNHNTRAYSSGCVRVEDYTTLALWLNDIEEELFNQKLENKRTRIEKTEQKIPVYYTYSQVTFVDNKPIFHPDVYKRNSDFINYM